MTVLQIKLVDTETGEVAARHTYSVDALSPQQERSQKGWVLRRRTAYKRQTGRKLKVVLEQIEELTR